MANTQVWKQVSKDLDSDNELVFQKALKFVESAEKSGPEFQIFHAQRYLASQQKANADGVFQKRVENGKLAAQQPKGKGQAVQGPRKRLDKMTDAEREELIERVGSAKYGEMLQADMKAAGVQG